MDEPQLNRFAVIGNPVAHSRSPFIHQSFAAQFNILLSYEKIHAQAADFKSLVRQFFNTGGRGLNITTPFKSIAAELADSCSTIAKQANSANTLYQDKNTGKLIADSTDGIGWLTDIRRLGIALHDSNTLVIGAGGTAGIIINQLLSESFQSLHICNRTKSRAQLLATGKITASGLYDLPDRQWDLIINTLPTGWQGSYPEINVRITDGSKAYDLNYGQGAEAFRQWFIAEGGNQDLFYDGWGMLVEQAAESFNLWWGKKPATTELINNYLLPVDSR